MAVLELRYQGRTLQRFPIGVGDTFFIGRQEGSDIVIDNLAVSFHHAKIEAIGEDFLLIDLKSENGTFVNGAPIRAHWLEDGDEIGIGKHLLSFQNPRSQGAPEPKPPSIIETMQMDTAAFRELLRRNRRPLPRRAGWNPEPFPLLQVIQGPRREIRLTDKPFRIGSDPSADLVVRGFLVPKLAAVINREEDGWHLTPAVRWPRVRVNGEPIRVSRRLLRLDVIAVGRIRAQFRTPS